MSDTFLKEIQDSFLIEAEELLNQTEGLFLSLEDANQDHIETFKQIKRLAHNFKGSGQAVGFEALAKFCHSLENLLIILSNGQLSLSNEIIELLLASNDKLKDAIATLRIDPGFEILFDDLNSQINFFYNQCQTQQSGSDGNHLEPALPRNNPFTAPVGSPPSPTTTEASVNTVPVEATKELSKVPTEQNKKNSHDDSIRVPLKRIDDLLNSFGEQVINLSSLEYLQQNPVANADQIVKTIFNLKKIAFELQQSTLALRMVNMRNLFIKLERAIKDTARMTNKKVEIQMIGIDQELDKTIIEKISDALTHMVRNSVDHGIESLEDRVLLGKNPEGRICLMAKKMGGEFLIEITDDGKGLNPDKIKAKAIEKGIINPNSNLSKNEILELIFENGFSTKDQASEISGRGIGMNVVKECIQELKGRYEINSEINQGTQFRIYLPLSLSMFNGMMIHINENRFIIPTSIIDEVINFQSIQTREMGTSTIFQLRDEVVELLDLSHVLDKIYSLESDSNSSLDISSDDDFMDRTSVLIAKVNNQRCGFKVDYCSQILRIVQKPLSNEMQCCPGASGVTILGDGRPAYILDLHKLKDYFLLRTICHEATALSH